MTILELLRSQLNDTVAERLGAAVNLGPDQAREVLAQALPLQVGALSQWAAAPGGAATLLDLARTHVPQGDAQEILSRPGGIQQLQVAGRRLLPELVGSTAAAQVAARTGALPSAVQGMMGLLLPLVLGVVSRQAGAGAGGSGGLSGLLGAASLGGAAGVAALGSAGLDNSDQGGL